MSSDLIVKLLFPVAEPVQMGMQMTLAIATLTGLLYNCFRTRLDYVKDPKLFALCYFIVLRINGFNYFCRS